MPKINYLKLELHSKIEISPNIAKEIVDFMCNYEDGSMQPEKYGLTEPLKEGFERNNLSKLIKFLSAGAGSVLFKRVNNVRYEGYIDDLRLSAYPVFVNGEPLKLPKRPKPKILTKVIFWIDLNHIKKKPRKLIEDFFKQLFIKLNLL